MVKTQVHGLPFHSLVTSPLPLAIHTSHTNPVIAHTLRIWPQFRKQFGLQKTSLMAPIVSNHLFTPAQSDLSFRAWHRNGIRVVKDLFIEGVFASFAQLAGKFGHITSIIFRLGTLSERVTILSLSYLQWHPEVLFQPQRRFSYIQLFLPCPISSLTQYVLFCIFFSFRGSGNMGGTYNANKQI